MNLAPDRLPILKSKLFRPRLTSDCVHRESLHARLDKGLDLPLILVSAPAGYGKSTLISSWIEKKALPHVWITLDDSENNIATFIRYVVAGLQRPFPGFGEEVLALLDAPEKPALNLLEYTFINCFNDISHDILFVLDDFHHCDSQDIMSIIGQPLKNIPVALHLVIITRQDPELPIARMRFRNLVLEIRGSDLVFTSAEILELLGQAGLKNAEQIVDYLKQSTEGWPAGLRMWLLRNKDSSGETGIQQEGIDEPRSIIEGLITHILNTYEPNQLETLLNSAYLDAFSASLIDAVVDNHDGYTGESIISDLETSNMFIIALDNGHEWFRFHHVFQDILKQIAIRRFGADHGAEVCKRAAQWYADRGDSFHQIQYLVKSGNLELAVREFELFRVQLMNRSDWTQIERTFQLFSPAHIDDFLILGLTRCWLHIYSGQIVDMFDLLDTLEQQLNSVPEDKDKCKLEAEFLALKCYRTYNLRQDYVQCEKEAVKALEGLPSSHLLPCGYAFVYKWGAMQALGRGEDALKESYSTLDDMEENILSSMVRLIQCYLCFLENDIGQLRKVANEMVRYGERRESAEAVANGYHFAAVASYLQGHFTESAGFANKSYELRMHTIGVIRLMNTICLLHSTAHLDDSRERVDEIIPVLEDIASSANNTLYSAIAEGAVLQFGQGDGDASRVGNWINTAMSLSGTPMTNFFNFQVVILQLMLRDDTDVFRSRFPEHLESVLRFARLTHNKRILFDLRLYEAMKIYLDGDHINALEMLESHLQDCQERQIVSTVHECWDIIEPVVKASDDFNRYATAFRPDDAAYPRVFPVHAWSAV